VAFWNWVILIGAQIVLGFLSKKLTASQLEKLRERDVTLTDPNAALPVIYGETRAPTYRVFIRTANKSKSLWQALAICHGEIEAVTELYLNGQIAWRSAAAANGADGWVRVGGEFRSIALVSGTTYRFETWAQHHLIGQDRVVLTLTNQADLDDQTFPVSIVSADEFDINVGTGISTCTSPVSQPFRCGRWELARAQGGFNWADYYLEGKAKLTTYLGSDTQVVDPDLALLFLGWGTEHRGRGVAYIVLRLDADQDFFPGGIPDVSVTVRGRKVFNPGTGTTVYSTNPALALRDYLTNTRYGLGLDAATELDATSFTTEQSYCDQSVSVPVGSIARYAIGGIVDTAAPLRENVEQLMAGMRGNLIYEQGRYRLFIRKPMGQQTDVALHEGNLHGPVRLKTPLLQELVNVVRVRWSDPAGGYASQTFEWPRPGETNVYLTADGGKVVQRLLDLPFVTNRYRAEHIASILRHESRSTIELEVTAGPEAGILQVGDRVPVTLISFGFDAKSFWVNGLEWQQDRLVKLYLLEYTEAAFSHDAQVNADDLPDSNLPSPGIVRPPGSLVVTSGTAFNRIDIGWEASDDAYLAGYELEFRRADQVFRALPLASRETLSTSVDGPRHGETWQVRIRAMNTLGIPSPWLSVSHLVVVLPGADYTVEVVAEDGAIAYDVTFLDAARVEVFTRVYPASGGALPPESDAFRAETLKPTGPTSLRIATPTDQWRRTKMLGYDRDGSRGTVRSFDTEEGAGGGGPSAPPSSLAQDTGNTSATQLAITATLGDASSQTRVYVDGIIRRTFAPGATLPSPALVPSTPDLAPDTTYQVEIDHYEDGVASAKDGPVAMATEALVLDTPTGFDAYGALCGPGDPEMGFVWAKGANAQSAVYRIQRSATGAWTGEEVLVMVSEAGATVASDSSLTSGTFFFRIRAEQSGYTASAWFEGSPSVVGTYGVCEDVEPI
jgi:hypothetical protein